MNYFHHFKPAMIRVFAVDFNSCHTWSCCHTQTLADIGALSLSLLVRPCVPLQVPALAARGNAGSAIAGQVEQVWQLGTACGGNQLKKLEWTKPKCALSFLCLDILWCTSSNETGQPETIILVRVTNTNLNSTVLFCMKQGANKRLVVWQISSGVFWLKPEALSYSSVCKAGAISFKWTWDKRPRLRYLLRTEGFMTLQTKNLHTFA